MRNIYRLGLAAAVVVMTMATFTSHALAAGSGLYLSPGSRSVVSGASFSVGVRMTSSTAINAVQVNLTYPANKLDYLSTSFSGSAFEIQAQSTGGGGGVQIARGTLSPASGDNLIATVTFRAKVNSGSAAIDITSDSTMASNGAQVASSKSGSTISFSAPVPVAPPPPPDKTPPTISNIKVTDIGTNTATISWTTNEAADSGVNYGLVSAAGLTVAAGDKGTSHKLVLNSSFMLPKTKYFFTVSSTDVAGNNQTAPQQSFTTLGIPLKVAVHDSKGRPVKDATVTAGATSSKTDANGTAVLSLGVGTQTVAIAKGEARAITNVTLAATETGKAAKAVSLTLAAQRQSLNGWLLSSGLLVMLALGGVAGYGLRSHGPLKHLRRHGVLHDKDKDLKVSELEHKYGDRTPNRNPYAPNSMLHRLTARITSLLHRFRY